MKHRARFLAMNDPDEMPTSGLEPTGADARALIRSGRFKMSLDEFHRLPFSLAWDREYRKGWLVQTPRQVFVHAPMPVAPRGTGSPAPLRPALAADESALLPCFEAAFQSAFEFRGYTSKRFAEATRQGLAHFFHGSFRL